MSVHRFLRKKLEKAESRSQYHEIISFELFFMNYASFDWSKKRSYKSWKNYRKNQWKGDMK